MEIVDTHLHLWTPETHPWVKMMSEPPYSLTQTCTLENYEKDVADYNVTQVVHVQAMWQGDQYQETRWLDAVASASRRGIPHAIIGGADLSSRDVEEVFQKHCQSQRVRGIRQLLNHHPSKPQFSVQPHDNLITDPKWQSGYALLEKYNLLFELHVLGHQMQRSADLIRKFPHVPVMVEHCGAPYERDEASMKVWHRGMAELSRCPNTYCKISGVFSDGWTEQSVADVVLPCVEMFGVDRCVFGSNFAFSKMNATFSEVVDTFMRVLEELSTEDKKKIFSENAKKFYCI